MFLHSAHYNENLIRNANLVAERQIINEIMIIIALICFPFYA